MYVAISIGIGLSCKIGADTIYVQLCMWYTYALTQYNLNGGRQQVRQENVCDLGIPHWWCLLFVKHVRWRYYEVVYHCALFDDEAPGSPY